MNPKFAIKMTVTERNGHNGLVTYSISTHLADGTINTPSIRNIYTTFAAAVAGIERGCKARGLRMVGNEAIRI